MLSMNISAATALSQLKSILHQTFQHGLAKYWNTNNNNEAEEQSFYWLFCWAKTTRRGCGPYAAQAMEALREIFDDALIQQTSLQYARDSRDYR